MSEKEVISLGFSPCPNDTFIFGALATRQIKANFSYKLVVEDVEKLNQQALSAELLVSKLSFGVFPAVIQKYQLLPVGGALGFGCGPVVVAKEKKLDFRLAKVAVPGFNTTAYFLFKFFAPQAQEIIPMRYDQIMPAVLNGEVDVGVLIHETRFVFDKYGLVKIADLGAWWEEETGLPIPLGGIFIKKDLDSQIKELVLEDINKSLWFAQKNKEKVWPYICRLAQEMDEKIINQHINTFVNEFTFWLSEEGRQAVSFFLEKCRQNGLLEHIPVDFLFLPEEAR
ncbi:1,4-dihydroxy-6-naphthoate synthase [Thermodesulfatator atlanticus]|uniref:1,4-dihydroxy-6-naphthoate synthase n=1 Tax=Thermodesulfatator atlanticus TaxID=501497 RepID=UPI0003B63C3C|nr:1,4-dihydroxy-6-naphthoate synthase [Thermodesulfatator atlanticus]